MIVQRLGELRDPDRLPALVELWNRALGRDFPMRPELLRQAWDRFVDEDASGAVVEAGRPVAFLLAKQSADLPWSEERRRRCWLSALAVDPDRQRDGLGSRLVARALEALRAAGATGVTLGEDPGYLLSGDPAGRSLGFWRRYSLVERGVNTDMLVDLAGWPAPDRLPALRPAREWAEVVRFLDRAFPGRWAWEAREHERVGTDPGRCLLLEADDGIAGFLVLSPPGSGPLIHPGRNWEAALGGRVAGIGPLGIDPARHGQGLGTGLVAASLARLRDLGVDHVVADWTSRVTFYERLGFRVWRRNVRASIQLD